MRGGNLDRADLALRRFQQHHASSALAEIDLRPVGVGVDVPAGEEIFATHLARSHARDARNHVAGFGGGLEIGHLVDDGLAHLAQQGFERALVLVQPLEIGKHLDVSG